jgi:hydroxypyruvate reductase
MEARRILLDLFDAAVRAVDGRGAVEVVLRDRPRTRTVGFAIGKAASSMARGAVDALQDSLEELFVVTKDGHVHPGLRNRANCAVIECAHPVPDERSLAAGAELERRLYRLSPGVLPLFLVSGGSSSLVELLQPGRRLEDLRELNQRGLSCGWDIATLNAERRKLSTLKGGGVARRLGGREALALFLSDVPGDDPGIIGSGLLGRYPGVADSVTRLVVANLRTAVQEAVDAAHAHGLVLERCEYFDGEAESVAAQFVQALRETTKDGLVWGGESTVKLPARPGRGGRNTHLALAAARLLRAGEGLTILAAATDGTDGPTDDAGAIVDAGTIERAELGGCDVERAYREFDSAAALEAAGDLVHTGPTGTNVGDLLVGLKHSANSLHGLVRLRML